MNKHTIKKQYPQFKAILKKTWRKSFDEDLDESNSQKNKVGRLIAVIQALSYGETKEDIEENLRYINKKWIKNHNTSK